MSLLRDARHKLVNKFLGDKIKKKKFSAGVLHVMAWETLTMLAKTSFPLNESQILLI